MSSELVSLLRADTAKGLQGLIELLSPLREGSLLVTGGTGFMGSWLAEAAAYLNDEHDFKLRTTLLSRHPGVFRNNYPHLAERPDITLVNKDVQSLVTLDQDTQWVIHAAASPDSRQHATDPLRTMRTIVTGTNVLLETCTLLPDIRSILVVSSGLVYGPQPLDVDFQDETTFYGIDPSALNATYIEAKRTAETLASVYRSQQRVPVVIARPFAFIGPFQLLDRPWAVNNFLRDGLAREPIRVLGDGETVRSYMYGADMAAWLLRMLTGSAKGAVYNLGSPEPVSLKELAHKVLQAAEGTSPVQLGVGGPSAAKRSRLVPDVTRAKGLGLSLRFSLDEALKRTVLWHRLRQS